MSAPAITTRALLALLQRHYIKPGAPLPGGIFLPECGWNGGYGGGCDALYVGFTSTSGRILVGHELKVSRADWLNELNKPGKADGWADQCHEWYLVVNDPAIVHDGELPAGWGLMSPGPSKTRMKIHHKADRKPATHQPSWTACRSIMARQDTLRAQAIADGAQRARTEQSANNRELVDAEVERRMRAIPDAKKLQERLRAIEGALGYTIQLDSHGRSYGRHLNLDDLRVIGQAAAEARDLNSALKTLTDGFALQGIQRAIGDVEKAIANIRALPGTQMELEAESAGGTQFAPRARSTDT